MSEKQIRAVKFDDPDSGASVLTAFIQEIQQYQGFTGS